MSLSHEVWPIDAESLDVSSYEILKVKAGAGHGDTYL